VALLNLNDLTISFPGATRPAVSDLSLSIAAGEVLGLVGESGSGKSLTSLAILRLLVPQAIVSGEITFDGQNLATLPEEQMRTLRGRRIAMIFQEPMTALNPVMRVGDQIAEALLCHNGKLAKSEVRQRVVAALEEVAMPEAADKARAYPHQLSGGQRQRIMIAMSLINRPQLLIADEPTTALDVTVQAQILDLLQSLQQRLGLAMLFISHDLGVVARMANRVAVMYGGELLELATREAIFTSPRHEYTRGLLSAAPSLRTSRTEPLATIERKPQPGGQLTEVGAGHWLRGQP
jgi:peptide/nickel transport system ATP-binding protein